MSAKKRFMEDQKRRNYSKMISKTFCFIDRSHKV